MGDPNKNNYSEKTRLRNVRVTANSLINNKKKFPGERWTDNEEAKLYRGLTIYGVRNVEQIASLIQSRTVDDVKARITYYKNEYSKTNRDHDCNNLISQCDTWLNKLQQLDPKPSRIYSLQMAFKIIELFEEQPDPEDCNGINFKDIYGWLYDCFCGHASRKLDSASSDFLLKTLDDVMEDINSDTAKDNLSNPLPQWRVQIKTALDAGDLEDEEKIYLNTDLQVKTEEMSMAKEYIICEKGEYSNNKTQIKTGDTKLEKDYKYEKSISPSQVKCEGRALGKDCTDGVQATYLKEKTQNENVGILNEANINNISNKSFPKNKKQIMTRKTVLRQVNEENENNTYLNTRSQVKIKGTTLSEHNMYGLRMHLKKKTQDKTEKTALRIENKPLLKKISTKKLKITNESIHSKNIKSGKNAHLTLNKKLQTKNKVMASSKVSREKIYSKKSQVKNEGASMSNDDIKSGNETYLKRLPSKNNSISLGTENNKNRKEISSKKPQVKNEGIALSKDNINNGIALRRPVYLTRLQVKNKGIVLSNRNVKNGGKTYSKTSKKNEVSLSEKNIRNEKKTFSKKKLQDKKEGIALTKENANIEKKAFSKKKLQAKSKDVGLKEHEKVKSKKITSSKKFQFKNEELELNQKEKINNKKKTSLKMLQIKKDGILLDKEEKLKNKNNTSTKILRSQNQDVSGNMTSVSSQVNVMETALSKRNMDSKKGSQIKINGALIGSKNTLHSAKIPLFEGCSQAKGKKRKCDSVNKEYSKKKTEVTKRNNSNMEIAKKLKKSRFLTEDSKLNTVNNGSGEKIGQIRTKSKLNVNEATSDINNDIPEVHVSNMISQIRLKLRSASIKNNGECPANLIKTQETLYDENHVDDAKEISSQEKLETKTKEEGMNRDIEGEMEETKLDKENIISESKTECEEREIEEVDHPDLALFSFMLEDCNINPLNLPIHMFMDLIQETI